MLTVTDLFAGAGGSSSGLERIPGVTVRIAANHWALAIETHNTNLPHADHDCADISQVDPRRYPRTDILWASPECTNHSQARGKKRDDAQPNLFDEVLPDEAAERSRATMWDVVRFAEHHRYRAVIIENVVDAYHWAPFRAWLMAMECLGYDHQLVWLNSMHAQAAGAPAPQSRDRMYVVFWRTGERRPDIAKWTSPKAFCPSCSQIVTALQVFKRQDKPAWGRYRAQYLYRCPTMSCRGQVVEPGILPAAAAIDWALPGERIGDRVKPLADKTRARIAAGLRKYGRPVHLEAGGNQYDSLDPKHLQHGKDGAYIRVWPADTEPLRTLHTAATKGIAYEPLLVPVEGRDGKQATSAAEVMRTATTRNETAVVSPPFLTVHRGDPGDTPRNRTVSVEDALPALTASGGHLGLVQPFIVPLRANNTPKGVAEPFDTFAAAGNHHAMVMRNNGSKGDGAEMCTPVTEELRTLTTTGHQSLVTWDPNHLLMSYYGNGNTHPVDDPMPTVTTNDRHALVSVELDVDDCYFRMLEPGEIKRGMAFAADYVMLGNKREQVRLAGNAVTPPAARDLGCAVVEALTGEAIS